MPSKALPEAQIIVRCKDHWPHGIAAPYVAAVKPSGDGQAVRCKTCLEPGLVWMTLAAWNAYLSGRRYFRPRTMTLVLEVSEQVVVRPS